MYSGNRDNFKMKYLICLVGWCFWILTLTSVSTSADPLPSSNKQYFQPFTNNPTVAVVEGQPIQLDELKNASIQQMMMQLYQMQKTILKQKVVEILQKNHPEIRLKDIQPVKNKEIESFYHNEPGIKDIGNLPEIKNEIRMFLEKRQRQTHLRDIDKTYNYAISKGWVIDHFRPPNDFRVIADIGTAMLWFPRKQQNIRKVFLMEYSDFLCPFCQKVQRTISSLRTRYKDKVQFGYRHFPLHQEAREISEAAECAREQGKFWQYQRIIYNNPQGHKNFDQLVQTARLAGVKNLSRFQRCLNQGKYRRRVENDIQEGIELGIEGTPSFIIGTYNPENSTINGEILSGAVTGEKFSHVIEKYLASLNN